MQSSRSFGHQGAYQVIGELGRGGFATVYKAYQASLDRFVAIKVLRAELVHEERGIERFQREARAAARLSGHPNIVTIYDYGEQEGMAYLVLEYIEGVTLQQRLGQPLSATEIEHIVRGVASALDYAHDHQLVHRDVKPSNVLIGNDGRVVLSDFGIAKLLDTATSLTGAAIGTPEYMSPEQITGAPVDARSDIYALGALVYRIFAGHPPFRGPLMAVLHKHVHERPPPLAESGQSIPDGMEEVVRKALAKDPAERHQNSSELATDVAAVLRPAILHERARAALERDQLDQADQIAAELLVSDPRDESARYVRREVLRRRQLAGARSEVARLVATGDWRGALAAIERLGLREARDSRGIELVRQAEELRAAELARVELERRRAEQERLRLERERAEREAREARERAERERLERERAERERAERERAEREARDRAAAERAERERLIHEARERSARARAEREARPPAVTPAADEPATYADLSAADDPATYADLPPRPTTGARARITDPQMSPVRTDQAPPTPKTRVPLVLAAALGLLLIGGGAIVASGALFGDPSPTPGPTATVAAVVKPTAATTATAVAVAPTAAPKPAEPTSPPATEPPAKPATAAPKPESPPTAAPATPAPTVPTPAPPTQPPATALPARRTLPDGVEMALVPAGEFLVGNDAIDTAAPRHQLALPPFYVDLFEVTNGRFAAFVEEARYRPQGDWRRFFDPQNFDSKFYDVDRKDHPVVNITWADADAYCRWAGKRLPVEAEWEKAARGTDGRRWPWGNEPHPEFANVETNDEAGKEPDTMRVGGFPRGASPYGALDMIGNVWEWTASAFAKYPLDPNALFTSPSDPNSARVTRGSSWLSLPNSIDVSNRLAEPPSRTSKDLGFRCVVSADQAPGR